MGIYTSLRRKGKGKVHFIDERKRPRAIQGEIIVDFESFFQPPYVIVKSESGDYLLPFNQVVYIEWFME